MSRLLLFLAATTLLNAVSCKHFRKNDGLVLGAGMPDGTSGVGIHGLIGDGVGAHTLDGVNGEALGENSVAPEEVIDAMMEDFERVHFGYDSYSLNGESREALSRNATLMQTWGGVEVEIQGHSDDRGSTEYNLALGQRRATAVRDALIGMGVAPSRVETMSFGEELPLERASGEIAWAQNRRAEFRVTNGDGQVSGTVE